MVRFNVRFDADQLTTLRTEATAQGISVAEVVRRAVRVRLTQIEEAPWMRYVGMVESGDPNSSQTIDEIVYGIKD